MIAKRKTIQALSKTFLTDFDKNIVGDTVNRMFMILFLEI